MKLDDYDFDDEYDDYDDGYSQPRRSFSKTPAFLYSLIVVSVCVLMTVGIVLVANRGASKTNRAADNRSTVDDIIANTENENSIYAQNQREVDALISGSTLTAQDLDIWEAEKPVYHTVSDNVPAVNEEEEVSEEVDPSKDGRHTLITYANGEKEWVEINQYLVSNNYDYSNLVYQKPFMKYYEGNRNVSFTGVDISKANDYVDFNLLKDAGVDFVMLRLGQRGYHTGEITVDEYFADNLHRAQNAGLEVGVYFWSSAISEEEAIAEADFVISTISDNKITYPVVFYMEDTDASSNRTADLTQMQRTNIAIAFMDKIDQAGYYPMLYGNKEYLIKKFSIGSLTKYDIWLDYVGDIPDYPYSFKMWRYSDSAKVNGIAGDTNLIISFIDYTLK